MTTTTATERCGACDQNFPTLAEVFSHPCDAIPQWLADRHGIHLPHATTPGDSVDAPEQTGTPGTGSSYRPERTNRYAGQCVKCGQRVPAEAGLLVRNHAGGRGASWGVEHRPGQCQPAAAPAPEPTMAPVEAGPPVTEKQAMFLRRLISERATAEPMDAEGTITALNALPSPRTGASTLIDHLLTLPRQPAERPAPADGYEPAKGDVHVVDGTYYRVHKAQGSGRFYGVRWNGTSWDYAKGATRLLTAATMATAEQAAAFGKLTEQCVYCDHPIDTPESTAVGYGPVCAARRGLPWGVTA